MRLKDAPRLSRDGQAMLVIAAVVILANLPYLLGIFEPNPLGPRASLASATTPGAITGQPTIDPNNGFVSQALGHRAALDLVHLHVPWWNPYEGTGAPLAGEMQAAAFFPPTLLTLLGNGQLYERVLFELVAGWATYLVLRRLRLKRWASVACAVAFGLNGTFAWFSHAPVNPVPLLPLLVLGVEFAYEAAAEGRHGGWWLVAIAGALSVYAGFPETAYIDAIFAAFWFAWRVGCLPGPRRGSLALKGVLGALVGALLCAPLAIAALDYFNHGNLGNHATALYGSAHISASGLPQLLMPYVYGPILQYAGTRLQLTAVWVMVGGYLTTSLLLLGGFGLFSRGRRGLRAVLGVWIVLALARMYGQAPLLGHVLGWLPGMSRIAFFRYGTPGLEFAVIVLAALGLDGLMEFPSRRSRVVLGAAAMLAVIAVAAVGARALADQLGGVYGSRGYFEVAVAWAAVVVVGLAVIGAGWTGRGRAAALCTVVAIDAVVLFATAELSAPRAVTVDTGPVAYLRQHLGEGRFFTLGPFEPNYGSYFGIASANINDLPIPSLYSHYIHARMDQYVNPTVFVGTSGGRNVFYPSPSAELLRNLAGYRAAGVDYIVTPRSQVLGSADGVFTLVDRTPTANIYRLSGAAPYFSAVGCTVRSRERQSATVSCGGRSNLTRLETDLPGWGADVDGHRVSIRRSGDLFQSVPVPAGTHTVRFSYRPPNIVWGELAFVAGVVVLVARSFLHRRRRLDTVPPSRSASGLPPTAMRGRRSGSGHVVGH